LFTQIWGGVGEKERFADAFVLKIEDETAFWQNLKPEVEIQRERAFLYATENDSP
jgi:hypothetical protein